MRNLEDLYVHELKDLYSAEKQLTEALPKMVEAATSPELREAFSAHLRETQQHFENVHQLLRKMDENPGNKKCAGMEGLLEEGEDAIAEDAPPAVKDAALIAAAQRVEHYEIAGYGTAREYARSLGRSDDARILDSILDQESAADEKLTRIATGKVNPAAMKG